MKLWQIVVPVLFGLALAGCRNDPSVALLERDNFKKEREINRLKYENEELKEALEANAPAQPRMLRGLRPGEMPPEPGTMEVGPPSTRPAPAFTRPGPSTAEPETNLPGLLHISPGMEAPPGEIPETLRGRDQNAPPRQPSPPSGPSSGGSSRWNPAGGQGLTAHSVMADNSPVAQITLHPALTGGIGSGIRHGDEGLLVVVEPRDFGGNIINAPGNISVALLDPALTGEQARLVRWDFAAAETQGMLRTGSQPGIHLRLPWNFTPAHDRLKVFVRYTTRDGRKLQAERLISVALNDPPPAGREALPDAAPPQTASRPQRPQWSPVR
jgi:hypothetical protein